MKSEKKYVTKRKHWCPVSCFLKKNITHQSLSSTESKNRGSVCPAYVTGYLRSREINSRKIRCQYVLATL